MRVTSILRSGRSAWKGAVFEVDVVDRLMKERRSVLRRISEPTGCVGQQRAHKNGRPFLHNPPELCWVSAIRGLRVKIVKISRLH